MSGLQPYLCGCPTEILLEISKYLEAVVDISALSRVSRRFHWLFSDDFLRLAIKERSIKKHQSKDLTLTDLFLHAVRHDSVNIITYLTLRSHEKLDLRGVIPKPGFQRNKITFIHHALVADAPRVAAQLAKHGADMIQEGSQLYPDLTPLCLTLARPSLVTSARELDVALRIACSFGLPRTTRMLLTRGAETDQVNQYGVAPIHVALAQRAPWFRASEGYEITFSKFIGHSSWESMVAQTMAPLVEFGADPNRKSETSRAHRCGYRCWKSLDCDHKCQTPMHLAAASGNGEAIRRLLNVGADPTAPNGEGYTPLYAAISHGHLDIARLILSLYPDDTDCDDCKNPIVHEPSRTTALHVACRFAFVDLVDTLLARGPNPNVTNICGNTAIHEVLGQTHPGMREDVVTVLTALGHAGADAAMPVAGECPWKMAKCHVFPEVRDMFASFRRTIVEQLTAIDEVYRTEGRDIRKIKPKPNQPRPSSPEWVYEHYAQEAPEELDAEKHFPALGDSRPSKPKIGVLIDISTDEPAVTCNSVPTDAAISGSGDSSPGTPWADMKKKEGDWVALEPHRKQQPGQNTRKAAASNGPRLGVNWSGPLAPKGARNVTTPPATAKRAGATLKQSGSTTPTGSANKLSGASKVARVPMAQTNGPKTTHFNTTGPDRAVPAKPRGCNIAGTGGGAENNAWVGGRPMEMMSKAADKPQSEAQLKKGGRGKKQWNRLQL